MINVCLKVSNNGIDVTHVFDCTHKCPANGCTRCNCTNTVSTPQGHFCPLCFKYNILAPGCTPARHFSFFGQSVRPVELGHQGFKQWLVAWLMPRHYLNQCRFINWSPRTNFNEIYAKFLARFKVNHHHWKPRVVMWHNASGGLLVVEWSNGSSVTSGDADDTRSISQYYFIIAWWRNWLDGIVQKCEKFSFVFTYSQELMPVWGNGPSELNLSSLNSTSCTGITCLWF